MPEGDFLCANLMPPGGVWRITRDGRQAPFLLEVEGRRVPPCNFVAADPLGRVWITLSTWLKPRAPTGQTWSMARARGSLRKNWAIRMRRSSTPRTNGST
jgi:hypothetical protein